MSDTITLKPIGHVRGGRRDAIDDGWDRELASIELDASRFTEDAVLGLDAFSHIEVVFHFDRVPESAVVPGSRHPRGNPAWPRIGIFAQRGKDRPNRLGITVCRLLNVEGPVLKVRGLDAIDGTPVLDIKPYMKGFAPRDAVREPGWAAELMRDYW